MRTAAEGLQADASADVHVERRGGSVHAAPGLGRVDEERQRDGAPAGVQRMLVFGRREDQPPPEGLAGDDAFRAEGMRAQRGAATLRRTRRRPHRQRRQVGYVGDADQRGDDRLVFDSRRSRRRDELPGAERTSVAGPQPVAGGRDERQPIVERPRVQAAFDGHARDRGDLIERHAGLPPQPAGDPVGEPAAEAVAGLAVLLAHRRVGVRLSFGERFCIQEARQPARSRGREPQPGPRPVRLRADRGRPHFAASRRTDDSHAQVLLEHGAQQDIAPAEALREHRPLPGNRRDRRSAFRRGVEAQARRRDEGQVFEPSGEAGQGFGGEDFARTRAEVVDDHAPVGAHQAVDIEAAHARFGQLVQRVERPTEIAPQIARAGGGLDRLALGDRSITADLGRVGRGRADGATVGGQTVGLKRLLDSASLGCCRRGPGSKTRQQHGHAIPIQALRRHHAATQSNGRATVWGRVSASL